MSYIGRDPTTKGAGAVDASTQRMTLASDDPAVTALDGIYISVDGLETQTGAVNETAPASDTASSGLNGRLQRIAQRLTTLIGSTLATSVADGSNVTFGAKADAKSTATDTTAITAMSVWKQISASVQAIASSVAGTLTVGTHAVTQSGTWTVQPGNTANTTAWKVDASSVAVPVTDNSGSLTVDAPVATPVFVRLSDGSAAITTLAVSLASVPSHAVTNAGTFATQSAITAASGAIASGAVASGAFASGALASGSVASGAFASGSIAAGAVAAGATSFVKLEDVASADADAGVPAMAVRKATPANTSGTDGDYEMLQMSAGRVWTSSDITIGGTAVDGNSGSKSAQTIRVVLATDQPQLTNKLLVTPDANSAVNVAQMNGVATTMGNGVAGTGVQRVAIASDNTPFQAAASNETGTVFNGTTAITPKFATIAASSSGNNTIVAANATKKLRIVAVQIVASAAVNAKWQSGASGTDLTGLAYFATNGGYVLPYNPVGWFETASNTLLNLNLSGAVPVGGSITYLEV
jgi:hypothetical protein